MQNKRSPMLSIAMRSMFDLDATAAREEIRKLHIRRITPETEKILVSNGSVQGVFQAVGKLIREGMTEIDRTHPHVAKEVRRRCLTR